MKLKHVLAISVFIIVAVVIYLSFYSNKLIREKMVEGNNIILRIEKFQLSNNRLPDSLGDIDIIETEQGPFYYVKEDSNTYILSFGTSLGESMTYYSDEKEWR